MAEKSSEMPAIRKSVDLLQALMDQMISMCKTAKDEIGELEDK